MKTVSRGVLAKFNAVVLGRELHARLNLMLEEICRMVETGRVDELSDKAAATMPIWLEYCEWSLRHRDGGELRMSPREIETDLVLTLAASGTQPVQIMEQVKGLRQANGWDSPRQSFLETWNDLADFSDLRRQMYLQIEEVELMVRSDQADGLQEKCSVALEFQELFLEWWRRLDPRKEPNDGDPATEQANLMLRLGVLGWEPCEIRRQLRKLCLWNGWPEYTAHQIAGTDQACFVWTN